MWKNNGTKPLFIPVNYTCITINNILYTVIQGGFLPHWTIMIWAPSVLIVPALFAIGFWQAFSKERFIKKYAKYEAIILLYSDIYLLDVVEFIKYNSFYQMNYEAKNV
jgi:hypothetical protein